MLKLRAVDCSVAGQTCSVYFSCLTLAYCISAYIGFLSLLDPFANRPDLATIFLLLITFFLSSLAGAASSALWGSSLVLLSEATVEPHLFMLVLAGSIDLVLIMSVNPGFGGQKFIPEAITKVKQAKELIQSKNSKAVIEVDGGVNLDTGKLLAEAGADVLVAGSFVFNSTNPNATIEALKNL